MPGWPQSEHTIFTDNEGNVYFAGAQAGDTLLKFTGDGILAIFPIEGEATAKSVVASAVAAAKAAQAAVHRLAEVPALDGEPPLEIVIALHIGAVNYGNIGAADRLDFTVIGPAVNLVSRIETAAKTLDRLRPHFQAVQELALQLDLYLGNCYEQLE